ncbi:hypothetical protein [Deinococcus fonticola]|uniref:hypothetical protein n=1 Tax=Deinococcus fonticola TaxID=2528713 RepID=UPI0010752ADD|nr:hypothetical protein [Deinococcus fonticola]
MVRPGNQSSLREIPLCLPRLNIGGVFCGAGAPRRPEDLRSNPCRQVARPFLASLDADVQEQIRSRLDSRLERAADGSIPLSARAWAVRGVVPSPA